MKLPDYFSPYVAGDFSSKILKIWRKFLVGAPPPQYRFLQNFLQGFQIHPLLKWRKFFFLEEKFWRKILEEILEENQSLRKNFLPNISSIFSSIWRYFWRKIMDEKQNLQKFSSKFSSNLIFLHLCWMKSCIFTLPEQSRDSPNK